MTHLIDWLNTKLAGNGNETLEVTAISGVRRYILSHCSYFGAMPHDHKLKSKFQTRITFKVVSLIDQNFDIVF